MRCPSCHHLNPDDIPSCRRCGVSLVAAGAPPPQRERVLNRYRLGPLLGEGAMSRVFQAEDEMLGRVVALKILSRELCESRQARERMAREAAALGRVTHPNVIGIHNVFEHEGAVVLELEYAGGGTLRERVRGSPLALADALSIMSGILAGLDAIHAAGVIHRDLKPSNILLGVDGTPKIGDLGVARDMYAAALTARGTALGTPEYMAPEQVRGEVFGPATDIYACGIILYELLAGVVPFEAENEVDVMHAQLTQSPDLVPIQHRAPPIVVHAVARALAKAPDQRWASARELAEVLARPSSSALPPGANAFALPVSAPAARVDRPAERPPAALPARRAGERPRSGDRRPRERRGARPRHLDAAGPGTIVSSLMTRSRRRPWVPLLLLGMAALFSLSVVFVLAALVGIFGLDLGRVVRDWYFG